MATWPSGSKASTTNLDAGTDKPSLARADIKQNVDNVNDIIDMFNISGPTNNQILKYNSTNTRFELTSDADVNTTYAISAETGTGGTNLRLTGSDAVTDDVLIANGTGITATRTDANTVTLSLNNTAVTAASYTYASITVDSQGRLTAASSGTAPVTSVSGGTGISSTGGTTPTISLANTAVTPASYTYSSITVDAQGRITSASSGTAPVTSVSGGTGITVTGTTTPSVALDNTAVTAASYTIASFTVDAQGRLTAASSASTTGSGNVVLATSPTLTTPNIGAATATSINKVTITAPAIAAILTIASGKTLTASNSLTFTGTDSSSVAFGAGGTVAYTSNKLSAFAATTSSELAGVISDETGSGALVFATSPTLVTPTLGAASATSINKLAITAPATSATLTIADGKTLTASNTLTFTGTDSSSVAFGTGGTVLYSGGALGTPSSGTVTNLTGTASININGTVGATTPNTGAFTTLSASSTVSGTGFSTYLASPPAIGGTAAAAGSFTTLSASTSASLKAINEGAIFSLGTTGGTIAPNVANGNVQSITLNAALTINAFTSPVAGQTLTLIITGGTAYTSITSTMKFAGGIKTLTGTAGCVDILTVYYDGTNYWASLGKDFK